MRYAANRLPKISLAAAVVLLVMSAIPKPAEAATETARIPWQSTGTTVCDTNCKVNFPKVATNKRLDLQFVSCISGFGNEFVVQSTLGIDNASTGVRHWLLWRFRDTIGTSVLGEISQPVVFSIPADHRPQIYIELGGVNASALQCTLSGELVFLKP